MLWWTPNAPNEISTHVNSIQLHRLRRAFFFLLFLAYFFDVFGVAFVIDEIWHLASLISSDRDREWGLCVARETAAAPSNTTFVRNEDVTEMIFHSELKSIEIFVCFICERRHTQAHTPTPVRSSLPFEMGSIYINIHSTFGPLNACRFLDILHGSLRVILLFNTYCCHSLLFPLSPARAPHSWFFVYSRVRLNSARSFYLIFAKLDTVDIAAELDRCEANETVPSGIDYNVNIFRVVMKKCQESNGEMPIYIYSALCSCGWEQQCVRTLCEMRTNNSPTYRRQNEVSSRKNVRASRSIRNFFI